MGQYISGIVSSEGDELMKKIGLLVLLVFLAVMPLTAKTSLMNIGYNIQTHFWSIDPVSLHSIGFNYTSMKGDTQGLYFQANPYFGLSFKNKNGSSSSIVSGGETLLGGSFLGGYGADINFGSFGIVVGGGGLADMNMYLGTGFMSITMLAGLGLGANAYFQPSSGNLIIDAGINAGWHPFGWVFGDIQGDFRDFGMFTINIHAGIGFRTGGYSSISSSTDW